MYCLFACVQLWMYRKWGSVGHLFCGVIVGCANCERTFKNASYYWNGDGFNSMRNRSSAQFIGFVIWKLVFSRRKKDVWMRLHVNTFMVWAFCAAHTRKHTLANIKFSKFTHSLFVFIHKPNNNILKTFIFPGDIEKVGRFLLLVLWLLLLLLFLSLPALRKSWFTN